MEYPVLDAKATGARIKELRKQKHLKVEDVSHFMGFESEQAVYKWQRGDSLPTVDNLYALSRLFETTVDDILRGEREEDESPLFFFYRKLRFHRVKKLREDAHSRDRKMSQMRPRSARECAKAHFFYVKN